jgi:hypothetical protein
LTIFFAGRNDRRKIWHFGETNDWKKGNVPLPLTIGSSGALKVAFIQPVGLGGLWAVARSRLIEGYGTIFYASDYALLKRKYKLKITSI